METEKSNPKGNYLRYRGLTERSKALVLLLRETPYLTSREVWRFFFPDQTSIFYTRLTLRVLLRAGAIEKTMLGNGVFIYFLTEEGSRYAEFLLQEKPRFDTKTESFYLKRAPRKASEALPYFPFPAAQLEFQRFTPKNFHSHPFEHTTALLYLT